MNMKRFFYQYTIKQKMVAGFLSVSLVSILFMSAIAHHYYSKSTKEDFFLIAEDATRRTNYQLDQYFIQLAKSTSSVIAGPISSRSEISGSVEHTKLIQEWLKNEDKMRNADKAAIQDILKKYLSFNHSEIVDIFLVSLNHSVIAVSGISYMSENPFLHEPWYDAAISEEIKVIPTYETQYSRRPNIDVISLIIPIFSTETVKIAGQLIMNLNLSQMRRILGQVRIGKTGYFFIISDDKKIVVHPEKDLIGKPLSETGLGSLNITKTNSVQKINEVNYLVSSNQSELSEWFVVAIVPINEMMTGLNIARNSLLFTVAILTVGIIVVVPIISDRFVHPLKNLNSLMKQVEYGDLEVKADLEHGKDEIQMLNKRFNSMTTRLKELVHTVSDLRLEEMHFQLRQKEAIIQTLQNQINPHLLYNSLDIIKSIAYLEGNEKIEIISGHLADIYRYSTNLQDIQVKLAEELVILQKYLDIIKVRFPGRFYSEIQVDENLNRCRIVKLSLQPVVENAVKYAVENTEGKAKICIEAFKDNDDLIIKISDDGPGFDKGLLADFERRLKEISTNINPKLLKIQSVGLINVHMRMVLHYGERYGISINSSKKKGAVVFLRYPLSFSEK